jgi:hypothetical protein
LYYSCHVLLTVFPELVRIEKEAYCIMEEVKKLSLAQCRRILEEGGVKYSDEQVLKIRDILYVLGELDYLIFKDKLKSVEKTDLNTSCDKAA